MTAKQSVGSHAPDGSTYTTLTDGAGNLATLSLDASVDGLETLVTSTNTKLDTLNTSVGTVNTSTNTNKTGTTPTDRTITSLGGSSETLMAANAARKYLVIQNTGTSNVGVNLFNGTAVIGGAGTLTLVPNGSYETVIPTLAAIKVIGTSGQPVFAAEV